MIAEFLMTARYNQILRILDDERRLILSGPLENLRLLVDKREKAIAELVQSENPVPEAFVAALKSRAERNGRLLQASIEGIRAATATIDGIGKKEESLQTYDARGKKVAAGQAVGTRDKRA